MLPSDFTEWRCFLLVWGLGFLGSMGVVLLFDFGLGATAVCDQGSYGVPGIKLGWQQAKRSPFSTVLLHRPLKEEAFKGSKIERKEEIKV